MSEAKVTTIPTLYARVFVCEPRDHDFANEGNTDD